jgi:hypothetical protein
MAKIAAGQALNDMDREMIKKGGRVFIAGYQDDDNYCIKDGIIKALRVFIDEDEVVID